MLTHLLTFITLCLCTLAWLTQDESGCGFEDEADEVVGLVVLGLAALMGHCVWTLRGILKEQTL